jgi:hypothetical protein
MRTYTMKTNPAFKRTQPLPLLSADFARRAGFAATSFARAMPLAGNWASAGQRGSRQAGTVQPGFSRPAIGCLS